MNCEKCKKKISDDDFWQSWRDYHILQMWSCWDCIKKHLLKLKGKKL